MAEESSAVTRVLKDIKSAVVNLVQAPRDSIRSSPPSSPIAKLPTDIVYYLLNRMHPGDAAALALSCKAYLRIFGGRARLEELLGNRQIRLRFLTHLETDFPNRHLCHICAIFHPLLEKSRWTGTFRRVMQCEELSGALGFVSTFAYLPFPLAQDVMNRYRYGGKHGCSVTKLSRTVKTQYDGCRYLYRRRAGIVQGQLIVKIEGSIKMTEPSFHIEAFLRCFYGSSYYDRPYQHIADFPDTSEPPVVFRCRICATEMRFSDDRKDNSSPRGLVRSATFTELQNLGPCDDPLDKLWSCAVACRAYPSEVTVIDRSESSYFKYFDEELPS